MFHSKGHIGESLTMPQNYFRRQVTKGHSSLSFLLYYERRCKRRDFAAGSGKSA